MSGKNKEKPNLMIIGNSNVGKSSITKLLLPNRKQYKGKIGKTPGSTLLIKPINSEKLPYKIVDLPGFGYMRKASNRREEHIKKQIVIHIEKHHSEYFFAIVVLNVLRIEDELMKYFIKNQTTIPLSFELINFLREFELPLIVLINKIDKISKIQLGRIVNFLVDNARQYGINLVGLDKYSYEKENIPYLTFSALKKINLNALKHIIQHYFQEWVKKKRGK